MSQVAIATLLGPVLQMAPNCPESIAIDAYVSAARRFCNRTRWLVSTLIGSTVAPVGAVGTPVYNLGSDTYNEIVGISAVSLRLNTTEGRPLTRSSSGSWDPDEPFGSPEVYEYIPQGQIALHPTPNAIYNLSIGLVLQPKLGSNSIDDRLLVNWADAFVSGALGTILDIKGQPWSDARRAAVEQGNFNGEVSKGKSDVAAGYNAGAAATDVIGPRSGGMRTRMQRI